MKQERKKSDKYPPEYYTERFGNDLKRQAAFKSEVQFIKKYIKSGTLLDIGCSTGEFIEALNWSGDIYGMEISSYAIKYAMQKGISFDKDIFNTKNYFDVIIYRGTIQHIDTPFKYLKYSYDALKDGGFLFIAATPNSNSIYYKLWNDLPFLSSKSNYYIPSDHSLINVLKNFGFDFVEIRYPYYKSPYASLLKDHIKFFLKLFCIPVKFAFWKSSMDIILKK